MHAGGTRQDATRVVFLVGATTAAGGLAAGWLNDRVGRRVLMIALPIFSAITLVSMTQVTGQLMILALGITGAVYGATITIFLPLRLAVYLVCTAVSLCTAGL